MCLLGANTVMCFKISMFIFVRVKLNIDDFNVIRVVGQGAFGKVNLFFLYLFVLEFSITFGFLFQRLWKFVKNLTVQYSQ